MSRCMPVTSAHKMDAFNETKIYAFFSFKLFGLRRLIQINAFYVYSYTLFYYIFSDNLCNIKKN